MMRADHRCGGGVGGGEEEREGRPATRHGIRAVELQPGFKTIQVGSKYKGHLDGHKIHEYTQTAVRVCSSLTSKRYKSGRNVKDT